MNRVPGDQAPPLSTSNAPIASLARSYRSHGRQSARRGASLLPIPDRSPMKRGLTRGYLLYPEPRLRQHLGLQIDGIHGTGWRLKNTLCLVGSADLAPRAPAPQFCRARGSSPPSTDALCHGAQSGAPPNSGMVSRCIGRSPFAAP